jgi:Mn2+/Fe2+ NRAMP family transporter
MGLPLATAGVDSFPIGTTFNPWMVFYQQSAIVDKKLQPIDYGLARWDTAAGAALTQLLTGAVLVSVAATVASSGVPAKLDSVGEISNAMKRQQDGRNSDETIR